MKKIAIFYLFMCVVSVEANAQKLWGDAIFGMTSNQVVQAYSQAQPLETNSTNEYSSMRMDFIALGEIPSIVQFKFWENKLYGVDWKLKSERSFDANKPSYHELLNGMKQEHPDSGSTKQYRASEVSETDRARLSKAHLVWLDTMVRFYSDNWSTKNGTVITMSMTEATRGGPVRIDINTENTAGLQQLQSQSAQLKREMQTTARQANKKAEEQRHSDFFEGFVGKNVKSLALAVGAPTLTTPMPPGEVIYVWEIFSGNDLRCKTSVFTKKNGTIYSWQWAGNNCRRKE